MRGGTLTVQIFVQIVQAARVTTTTAEVLLLVVVMPGVHGGEVMPQRWHVSTTTATAKRRWLRHTAIVVVVVVCRVDGPAVFVVLTPASFSAQQQIFSVRMVVVTGKRIILTHYQMQWFGRGIMSFLRVSVRPVGYIRVGGSGVTVASGERQI